MTTGSYLAHAVRVDVGIDGRLLFADEPVLQLHRRAGGVQGGALAIPALAALAQLTLKLRMRLARSVRVADIDEDIELWVRSHPEGDIARLFVESWRTVPAGVPSAELGVSESEFNAMNGTSIVVFDSALRLVSASGDITRMLAHDDFGNQAGDIIQKIAGKNLAASDILKSIEANQPFGPVLVDGDGRTPWLISGASQLSANGSFAGYSCRFNATAAVASVESALVAPGISFGRQLAPALRQPLGRIIANAETIGSELNGPIRENYALYAKDIADAARHLVALVDDLGDLEAVERADFSAAKDNIELGDIARRVAGLLAVKAADHRIALIAPDDTQNIPAIAEFRRVLQIVINLVTNAIRYSPDGTEVRIDVDQDADMSVLDVTDQGYGIDIDDRDKIFEKFERLGRSGDGGSGLGLYISRRLARAMGGDLTVDNDLGGGAKFTLRLPRR